LHKVLRDKIEARRASVSVIGLGYVGLPLAISIAEAGFEVYGIDVSEKTIRGLSVGKSHIRDVSDQELQQTLASGHFSPTHSFEVLTGSDVVVICVPTPLRKSKDPDVSYILSAVSEIKQRLHPGMLVILESTTYPGTSDELIAAEFDRSGFRVGADVFVCFSPERVDPGNQVYQTKNTPKVIGGVTPESGELGALFYSQVVEKVVPVSSARVAETVKSVWQVESA
jgi:UDP-N-acetyl-D-glucosamine dehydrogenase